jgi:LPXTG-motif cell wall-anchored protein
MPQTSSNLPLFGLIGLASIGAALVLGSFTKRID